MSQKRLTVNFIKTLWGVTEQMGNCPNGYDKLFARIKADGFQGVETPISLVADKAAFSSALSKHDMRYVAMINTCTFDTPSSKLEDHISSFKRLVAEAKELNPLFINSHSGRDSWDIGTAKKFFDMALKVEEEEGIMILHETHRGRILYNPWITRDLCEHYPGLKLTADLSHFCVVAERVFDVKSGVDDDWAHILEIIADRTRHIHARVGYAEGPQVPDPAAPEYHETVEQHEVWWDAILSRQAEKGVTEMTLEPEHGTDGYQQRLPYTQQEVADLWVVNKWIRDRQAQRMQSLPYWKLKASDDPKAKATEPPTKKAKTK